MLLVSSLCRKKFVCMLTHSNGNYSCSVKTFDPEPGDHYGETFDDTDIYEISLCHNQNNESETCEPLIKEYAPDKNGRKPANKDSSLNYIRRTDVCWSMSFWFGLHLSPFQLNQTPPAASESATTQVDTTSAGRVPMRSTVLSLLCQRTWSISSVSTDKLTNRK